jgi:type II secretory pathway component PulJ
MKDIRKMAASVKNDRRRLWKSVGGFTLLELLISMTMLVLVVVIAMGALSISSRSVTAGEKRMEAQDRLRAVISAIDAQVESHIPLTYQDEGSKKYYFQGDKKSLRFSTNYSIWSGRQGYVIVTYKIEDDPGGQEFLSASEQVPGLEGRRESRLLKASLISFDYFLKESAEEQGNWVETLSDGLAIPEKIRVHLTQGSKQSSLVFPVRAGGKMMTVQSAASPRFAPTGRNVRPGLR